MKDIEYIINPSMTVIETVDNALLLKNNKDDGLVSLSEIEYDILQIWSRSNDSKEVIERFEKEYGKNLFRHGHVYDDCFYNFCKNSHKGKTDSVRSDS